MQLWFYASVHWKIQKMSAVHFTVHFWGLHNLWNEIHKMNGIHIMQCIEWNEYYKNHRINGIRYFE